ncbi:MAG TPA: chemotaxis-specific protein-glutamate methyltransferase CheB [Planctomycetota bacterium]|nr:chemotaxis-specific protein-glutamate methyltransferase CheB [Planctomycetota bacterium]
MRLAIVNDQPIAVEAIQRVLSKMIEWDIAWVAENGAEAVKKCAADKPDLVLMDLVMPVMDGAEATRCIMKASPCNILIVTSSVDVNFKLVFDAMGHGALDAVNTPAPGKEGELLQKVASIAQRIKAADSMATGSRWSALSGSRLPAAGQATPSASVAPLLAIGASTGGPQAVAAVLKAVPKNLPDPVVVIQHLGSEFTAGLAHWLSEQTGHQTLLAKDNMRPLPGVVYLAATDDHLALQADGTFHYTPEPRLYPYRPSVDVFFRSARKFCQKPGVAVLLTGMGRDGAGGLLELRQAGWHTIAQDRASCVVYGMPKAAAELNAACEVLPLNDIGAAVARKLK